MLSDIFSEEYVRKMREKDAEERGMARGMARGEAIGIEKGYENALAAIGEIQSGCTDKEISERYGVKEEFIHHMRTALMRYKQQFQERSEEEPGHAEKIE